MKTVLAAALALLVGFFVGGLAPRSEVRKVKKELSEARAAAESARSGASMPLALGMGSLFAARELANGNRTGERPAERPERRRLFRETAPEQRQEGSDPDGGAADGGRRRRFLGDAETFAAAKAAADMRAAQFRAAFVEEARLDQDGQQRLDEIARKMNEDLAAEAEKIAALVEEKGEALTPRDMADIGVRLLQIYQGADDKLRAFLGPEQAEAARKTRFDVLTQVDLGSFRRLSDVAERLARTQEMPR